MKLVYQVIELIAVAAVGTNRFFLVGANGLIAYSG
jgi:hypothetical protein